jgi:hypothetical protein
MNGVANHIGGATLAFGAYAQYMKTSPSSTARRSVARCGAQDEEEHRLFERDPFIYFYEDFLGKYDAKMKKTGSRDQQDPVLQAGATSRVGFPHRRLSGARQISKVTQGQGAIA